MERTVHARGATDGIDPDPESGPTLYGDYCRPKLDDLLKAAGLEVTYRTALGTVLVTDDGHHVTDFVGGYGTCLLGHNPPELTSLAIELLRANTPVHVQVSNREAAGALARRLSALVPGEGRYIAHFSNSGTEAIEAAVKHAYKVRLDRIRRHFDEIASETSAVYHRLSDGATGLAVPGGKSAVDFRSDLDAHNLEQFESFQKHPVMIAFLGAFHGKTTSALKLTYNHAFRDVFEGLSAIETEFVDPADPGRIAEIVQSRSCEFLRPVERDGRVVLEPAPMTRAMACILEPIQGEGGIRPIPDATLRWLADRRRAIGLPLIVDEVQTGCGRTGRFLGIEGTPLERDTPEYMVLGKALGGGVVKIAATLIRSDVLDHDFGILHTSTFAEDEFSCLVAGRVVDIITRDDGGVLGDTRAQGALLRERLERLRSAYPELVAEVRGRGLMLALEFTDLAGQSPFFRAAGRQGFLSILLASYLLRHHRIRVLGPLTNMLNGNPGRVRRSILRLQPPAVISTDEIEQLVEALDEALAIIRANDEALLVGHLVGWTPDAVERRAPRLRIDTYGVTREQHDIDARTAFIIHPTSLAPVREYYFPSLEGRPVSDQCLESWWMQMSRFLDPVHVDRAVVTSRGFRVEMNLVMLAYLPAALAGEGLRRRRVEVRDKIQDAVTLAKELGDDNIPVTMVGLGAYTSIATNNGQTLNDHEIAVTTGNAYTAALTLEGVARAALAAGLDLSRARVGVVGAGGNIGRILSAFLARSCAALVLFGSGRTESSTRLEATRAACLADTGWDGAPSPFPPRPDGSTCEITCATDLCLVRDCDVVVVATSSPNRDLVTPDMVKAGAIVCCASLPSNLSAQFGACGRGIVAFNGGLARLPEQSEVPFVGLPEGDLTFGCLAETLLLGFEGYNHSFCTGPITVAQVAETWSMAARHGFGLGALKLREQA